MRLLEDPFVAEQGSIDWKKVRERAGPFPMEAFAFVRDGLQHTVRMIHGEGTEVSTPQGSIPERHVSGQQLCIGLRDFAIRRYGMLARTVLGHWGIARTDDFGKIVFAMIDAGVMRKSHEDSFKDFQDVYDFEEAFTRVEVN